MSKCEEYRLVEEKFASRSDALCENVSPALCDCAKCPAKGMCDWLCQNSPY